MTIEYLKQATPPVQSIDTATSDTVRQMLADIEVGGEDAVRRYARELDGREGDIVVGEQAFAAAARSLSAGVKANISFARQRVMDFARQQRGSMGEFQTELLPGQDINPAILYDMQLCGADRVLALGSVQVVAAPARCLLGAQPADIIAGPGNRFVAEAKRMLFGRIGIDAVAGPTESAIIADDSADPAIVTADLVGQAEHGPDSPVSVGKFIKTVTWQRLSRSASRDVGEVAARISRLEGMEGHAFTGDIRLRKYFLQQTFDLGTLACHQG